MAITREEMEQIYRRCFARAMELAVSLLHDEEDARDVVQEVFVRFWETPIAISNYDAFVFRSVRNACINRIETLERRERIRRLVPLDTDMAENITEERIAAIREAAGLLLSERENEVVERIFSEGKSYKEAAQELGITVSSINKHVVNALRKLRNHFKAIES